uniref:Uncharacterized protein n=1 Tax=Xenopus tropicalis TaxID=8364 RepID=A0A803KF64_XENTR
CLMAPNENMDPSCLVTTVQAGGGVMVWGMFSWHTLGPLVPIGHRLNATAYLSMENVRPSVCQLKLNYRKRLIAVIAAKGGPTSY